LLGRLPEHMVAALIQGGQRSAYPRGAIVPEWDSTPWAAVVLRGAVRVFIPEREGGQITLLYLKAGDFIGSFTGTDPGLARSLQALEPLELLNLDATRLASLAQAEPPLAFELLLEAGRVMRMVQRCYGIRTFGSVRVRVANALLDRAAACGSASAGTVVQGTQHELANAAGTVREVVATALQGLKRDGMIAIRRGAVVLLDPERLAREADGGLGFGLAIK
jgi:CRP/FNR family transcriptional regulator